MIYLNCGFIKLDFISKFKLIKNYIFYLSLLMFMFPFSSDAKNETKGACDEFSTQRELNQCYYQQFKVVDAELNRLYQELIHRLKAASALDNNLVDKDYELTLLNKLKKSQRLWIQFRDAECDISVFSVQRGTIEPMMYSICLTKITEKRNEELRYYLNCEDNDFACPFPSEENLRDTNN